MALPLATTTISILRAADPTDGYPDTEPSFGVLTSGIRAHITKPQGSEEGPSGQRGITTAHLLCDPCGLRHTDYVRDDTTSLIWSVEWVAPRTSPSRLDHLKAGINAVDGELRINQPVTA